MHIELSDEERASIDSALVRERRVRHWRRYQAIRLLAEGHSPRMVAATLGVSVASVYNWAEAWRQRKHDGMKEGARPGRTRQLDAAAEGMLATWLSGSPRAYGHRAELWTVPLLRAQLARAGYRASEHTLRRALHRLGWRWKDGTYVLLAGRGKPAAGHGDARLETRTHARGAPQPEGRSIAAPVASSAASEASRPADIGPELPAPALGLDMASN